MRNDILGFFQIERQIFGVCPKCGSFFRLSECKIHLKEKRVLDWLDTLLRKYDIVERAEEKLLKEEGVLREKAREKGRKQALEVARKIDAIFTPRGLNPDDAKVIFHPIDYVVFNGMKDTGTIKNVVLLDRERMDTSSRRLQRSIEKTIESGNYEWLTMVIDETGCIKCK
ncbi:MAG: Holliday junction resolvase-like protein [Dehalococcoidia bacterium]|jgi:predicted Holliday junction resolvase-like endonuclease